MSFIEGPHPLLEARSPPYSNATVRRAFIVWMHCGQRNSFKDVCNYYHYLETLEDQLPADRRASSRHHEFNMFLNPPPTSPYLDQIFPKLYTQSNTIQNYIKKVEAVKNEPCVFKLEGFTEIKSHNCITTNEIVETSHLIKKYCKSRLIPLGKFLTEFKEYSKKCELNSTVNNVAFYIKRKMVEEELLMVENYSKSLSFLNSSAVTKPDNMFISNMQIKQDVKHEDSSVSLNMNEKQLKFLSAISCSQKQKITTLTRDNKNELTKQYWNDLTNNYYYVEMKNKASVAKT